MPTIQGAILGVIIAAFAGLVLVIVVQHHSILTDQEKYEALLKSQTALQAENSNWKIISENQNKKIAALAVAQSINNAAVAKARNAASHYTALAEKIEAQKIPADDCAGAASIKDFYLKNWP